jgi:hypothetical protein
MDNVDKETQSEKKSERLKPDERPSRIAGNRSFGFFGKFLCLVYPVRRYLFS